MQHPVAGSLDNGPRQPHPFLVSDDPGQALFAYY